MAGHGSTHLDEALALSRSLRQELQAQRARMEEMLRRAEDAEDEARRADATRLRLEEEVARLKAQVAQLDRDGHETWARSVEDKNDLLSTEIE